jgi:hypothetical protein
MSARLPGRKILGKWHCLAAAVLVFLAAPLPASADVTFELDIEFSGATPPASATTPWIVATFEDIGGGVVRLTMSAPNLTGTERVGEWDFNLDPTLNPNSLLFDRRDDLDGNTVVVDDINTGVNAFKADGDGFFDIQFLFDAQSPGSFQDGEQVIFDISGIAGLDCLDFNFDSFSDNGGHGPFKSAAHVQSIGPSGANSGWIAPSGNTTTAVPVPPSIVLAGLGGFGFVGWVRRKKAVAA